MVNSNSKLNECKCECEIESESAPAIIIEAQHISHNTEGKFSLSFCFSFNSNRKHINTTPSSTF